MPSGTWTVCELDVALTKSHHQSNKVQLHLKSGMILANSAYAHLHTITYVSDLKCSERIEFTIFHEILHILTEQDGEIVSELHDHFYYTRDDRLEKWALEALCNVGAAEFFMPLAVYVPFIRDRGWQANAIPAVASEFKCSNIPPAFQFALTHPKPCTTLVCEHGIPPRRSMEGCSRHRL